MSTPLQSLAQRRYLISGGPWRAFLYVLTTLPIAAPVAAAMLVVLLPWLAVWGRLESGIPLTASLLFLVITSMVLLAGFGPLVAIPLAAVERARLPLLDPRSVRSAHRSAPPGDPIAWLRLRYTEPATWREVLYGVFLGVIVPAVYAIFALLAFIDLALIVSPIFAGSGSASWNIGVFTVHTVAQSLPLAAGGLLLAPVLAYLFGLIAVGQAATARALLGERDGALQEVAQSRARLADAFDAERRRIERDLHDGAQHRLTSLTLQLGMARLDVPDDSPAAPPLTAAHEQAKELMVVLRDLIHGIRPQALTDLGLPAALRELAGWSPLPVTVTVADGVSRPAAQVEGTAYFVASEALANVVKHSGASRADVLLARAGEALVLEVRDDGHGGADPAGGSGLTGLADRVAAVGGRVLLSSPDGGPTLVRVELPWQR
ncbi:MAG: sensor domain-containing protein [Actinoplanes sp.]